MSVENGVEIRLYPARFLAGKGKFAFLVSPKLLKAVSKSHFDVAHIHLSRDLLVLPAAVLAKLRRIPYVVQPHGMLLKSARPLALALDFVSTRALLVGASRVLTLTSAEEQEILRIAPEARTASVVNGIELGELPKYEGRKNLVLFLARLQERKRPLAFVEMAARLKRDWPAVDFVLYGPDEGQAEAVVRACAAASPDGSVRWDGPVAPEHTDGLLSNALVSVLPSHGEVFPMSMLEAFRNGTPVVGTDSLGIAEECRRYGAALITDGTVEELAEAVDSVLRSGCVAESLRRGAFDYISQQLNVDDVARMLGDHYRSATSEDGSKGTPT
ncbi:glycosyltransferase involved in cell wall biosynthesis [Microbacterium testaceum]|nr:glycosyltransferase involved in cell wall biosynthesis [Microbacterium sp. SORGH_AS_0969]MDQ1115953.1 glycosyltransferase involved in cell wall biosynthesis [Microbacterium testaceum]